MMLPLANVKRQGSPHGNGKGGLRHGERVAVANTSVPRL